MALELNEEKDDNEDLRRELRDVKDENKDLKSRGAETDEDDADATIVPSGYDEKIQDNGDDGDNYHAKIQALEKAQEFKSEANRTKYGLVIAQTDVQHQVWEKTKHLVWENTQLREDNKVLSEDNRVLKDERDDYKGALNREREVRQKQEHGVASGRVTKHKAKIARPTGALADDISLVLRKKE